MCPPNVISYPELLETTYSLTPDLVKKHGTLEKPLKFLVVLAEDETIVSQDDVSEYDDYHTLETDECRTSTCDESDCDYYNIASSVEMSEYDVLSPEFSDQSTSTDTNSDATYKTVESKVVYNSYGSEIGYLMDDTDSEASCWELLDTPIYKSCIICNEAFEHEGRRYQYCNSCFRDRKCKFPLPPKGKKKRKSTIELAKKDLPMSSDGSTNGKENPYLVDKKSSKSKRKHHEAGGVIEDSDYDSNDGYEVNNHEVKNHDVKRVKTSPFRVDSMAMMTTKLQSESIDDDITKNICDKDSGISSGGSQDSPPPDNDEEYYRPSTCGYLSDNETSVKQPIALRETKSCPAVVCTTKIDYSNMCRLCFQSKLSAVFCHTKSSCGGACYKCAVRAWKKIKACPFCKCRVKNVLRHYVH